MDARIVVTRDVMAMDTCFTFLLLLQDDLLSLRNCAASILYPGLLRIELPIDVAK